MSGIWDWSSTASSNTSCDGTNINTGMSPAGVDNALRSIMALVRGSFASALQNFLAGTAGLPVANGGTGGTDQATGLAGLGALSSTYRDIPYRQASSAFSFADTDRAGAIEYTGAAAALTINPHSTTPIGTAGNIGVIVVANHGTGALTTTLGSGVTLFKNGSNTSASATIAPGGQAAFFKFGTSDVWSVTGSGIS